ncbi:hypothetical protein GEMRC1_011152 [Eukaryota sp. GEM-RC1]
MYPTANQPQLPVQPHYESKKNKTVLALSVALAAVILAVVVIIVIISTRSHDDDDINDDIVYRRVLQGAAVRFLDDEMITVAFDQARGLARGVSDDYNEEVLVDLNNMSARWKNTGEDTSRNAPLDDFQDVIGLLQNIALPSKSATKTSTKMVAGSVCQVYESSVHHTIDDSSYDFAVSWCVANRFVVEMLVRVGDHTEQLNFYGHEQLEENDPRLDLNHFCSFTDTLNLLEKETNDFVRSSTINTVGVQKRRVTTLHGR